MQTLKNQPHGFYDCNLGSEDWRDHTAPKTWGAWQNQITEFGRAQQYTLMNAIGYIITHELHGTFPPKAKQKNSPWVSIAISAFDWYQYCISSYTGNTPISHDPAAHFRALRVVLATFAALRA